MSMDWHAVFLPIACFGLSAFVVWLSILYAHRRALYDQPGQRRSHSAPTPRGGGIGIVVAAMAACAWVYDATGDIGLLRVAIAVGIVAAAGWIDDHRGLGVVPRLAAHFFAAALLLSWYVNLPNSLSVWLGLLVALTACTWSINLHNFMDGINGLLAAQSVFVLGTFATLLGGVSAPASLFLLWGMAVLGFLPFNFPRARIFMGDVGSGTLGLMISAGVLWLAVLPSATGLACGLIACSAFVTDATCTLLSRMLHGRRWYSAHREHLYQWLVRSGFSHARVVVLYMGWNLFVVAPVLYAVNRGAMARSPLSGFAWMLAVYALAFATWIGSKRWCLQHAKNENKPKV